MAAAATQPWGLGPALRCPEAFARVHPGAGEAGSKGGQGQSWSGQARTLWAIAPAPPELGACRARPGAGCAAQRLGPCRCCVQFPAALVLLSQPDPSRLQLSLGGIRGSSFFPRLEGQASIGIVTARQDTGISTPCLSWAATLPSSSTGPPSPSAPLLSSPFQMLSAHSPCALHLVAAVSPVT